MRDQILRRTLLLIAVCCASTLFPGCSDNTTAKPASPAVAETPPTEPVPFNSIALSSDVSAESVPIPVGTTAGEIREFTALKIKFCWCPPGTFLMGSPADAAGSERNEQQFEVTLSKGFWIQQTELTQAQYEALMGVNPSHFRGASNPVESVTYSDAIEFCRRLSELPAEKKFGNRFRLPTEAEWEYACRSGSTASFCFGDDESMLKDYGWFNENSARTTHPVATKNQNAWGLHDLHGNVAEWCNDWYTEYPTSPQTDPQGAETGDKIVVRGGGWFFVPQHARSAHRDAYPVAARYAGLGMRVVAEPGTETVAEPGTAPLEP